jgi:hypothetical protein
MRALAVPIVLSLVSIPALAASPQTEAAVKVFQTVGTDANRMKTFCELMQLDEKIGGKKDAVVQAEIDKLIDGLGPDFKTAWQLVESIDDESADGKVLNAAVDELSDKCRR